MKYCWFISIPIVLTILACSDGGFSDNSINTDACDLIEQPSIYRPNYIPVDAVKMLPAGDPTPPVLHLTEMFHPPEPLNSTINTAGAEDSPFFAADAETLYFWFTPDVQAAAGDQALDPSTGIYRSQRQGDEWQSPQKVWLFDERG